MVLENFSFSTQSFSFRNDSNNFSDLIKLYDKDDEPWFEENIDDNFIGINTELSSLSSITTTTSAYSSCSESSNFLASSCGDYEDLIDYSDSNLFIQQIYHYIDLYYHAKNCFVSEQVSNCPNLRENKKFWDLLFTKLNENDSKQDFFVCLSKILLSITTLENELVKHLDQSIVFESEFVINLAFLLYENAERLVNSTSNLVFEIEINNDNTFEKILNSLILKYVPKYISCILNDSNNGRKWIEFFKSLLETEYYESFFLDQGKTVENYNQYDNYVDTEIFLSNPVILNEFHEFKNSNPISQSYKVLASNLNHLRLISNDPTNDFETDSELFGRFKHDRSKLFSYFSASYYTMGLFDLKKTIFENTLEYLYESKYLKEEHTKMFKKDCVLNEWKLKMIDSLKITHEDFYNLFEVNRPKQSIKKSKWDFETREVNLIERSPDIKKTEKSLYDEIIERIGNLNTSIMFNSYFNSVQDTCQDYSCDEISPNKERKYENNQSNRSWTVAPKLFSKNTINKCCSTELQKRFEEFPESRNRSEPRPIGSKPASMFTISNSNQTRNRINNSNRYVCLNTNNSSRVKESTNTLCMDNFKSVWKLENDLSPFVTYENFNMSEYLLPKTSPIKISPIRVDLEKRSNYVQEKVEPIKNKKYSVAPIGLIGKKFQKSNYTTKSPPNSEFNPYQKKRNVYSYERNYNGNQNYSVNEKNFKIRY